MQRKDVANVIANRGVKRKANQISMLKILTVTWSNKLVYVVEFVATLEAVYIVSIRLLRKFYEDPRPMWT